MRTVCPDCGHSFDVRKGEATRVSQRGVEVLRLIAQGNTNKEIGKGLGISEQTVKNHVGAIMDKLNARDRTHAVIVALKLGYFQLEEVL